MLESRPWHAFWTNSVTISSITGLLIASKKNTHGHQVSGSRSTAIIGVSTYQPAVQWTWELTCSVSPLHWCKYSHQAVNWLIPSFPQDIKRCSHQSLQVNVSLSRPPLEASAFSRFTALENFHLPFGPEVRPAPLMSVSPMCITSAGFSQEANSITDETGR